MAHKAGIPTVYGTDLFADMHDQQLQEFVIRSEVQPAADLVRSGGNPLDDIRVLTAPDRNLKLIMKEGRVYKNELGTSR